ncbi:MAG: thiol reductant ABC exporter subunit CydD [Pseudomonadota bacterium]|nr:thiol reductant ABC exporter subunit CydD [Pseudomonadota bacterium]
MPEDREDPLAGAARLKAWNRAGRSAVRLSILAVLLDSFAAIAFAFGFAGTIAALADGQDAMAHLALAGTALALRGVFGWLRTQASEHAGQSLVAAARIDIARSAGKTGPALFDGADHGTRTAQLVDRTALLAGHASQWLPGRMAAVVTPVCIVAAVFTQSWLAGTMILASTVMLPVFIWLTASETAALARAQQASLDSLAGVFEARVRMAGTIRAFNGVAREAGTIEAAADELARRTMAILRVAFLSTAVLEFFASISIALVAVYVGFKLLGVFPFETFETLTLQEGLVALILAPEFYAPIRQLSGLHHARSDASASAATLGTLTADAGCPATTRLPERDCAPHIVWNKVDLARSGTTVVSGVTASAEPGTITVLWGPSGSGKTSLLLSLIGLAEPVGGHIAVDGEALGAGHSLAASAAWIGQKPWALEGSVRDNLRLAAPPVTPDSGLTAALEAAGCGFLDARGGLDYRLGPAGQGLSGGELQRLALARAIAGDARLLLLDEPTAHLDAEREAAFLKQVRKLAIGRTVLIASHHEAVRALADRVIDLGAQQ